MLDPGVLFFCAVVSVVTQVLQLTGGGRRTWQAGNQQGAAQWVLPSIFFEISVCPLSVPQGPSPFFCFTPLVPRASITIQTLSTCEHTVLAELFLDLYTCMPIY